MNTRGIVAGVLACLALTGCGASTGDPGSGAPFTLPVGPGRWDADAPAWYHDGTLHVGERTVRLGGRVDRFVLGATGVYWVRGSTLMFTSAAGRTQRVEDVGWDDLAVSADRSVFATVDQSRGPTDDHGTHVIQVAVFDTRTGEQLYRTPDEEPRDGDDLADLYGEVMPLLQGVSEDRVFFDGSTILLDDASTVPASPDADGVEVYDGYADTLFPDGYHVAVRGEGAHRRLTESSMYGAGRLSPDRSTIFDVSQWPAPAVVYDAGTGRQAAIDAPWDHFTLGGWSDTDTFFGVAERIDVDGRGDPDDLDAAADPVRARQVVTCELRTLACTPVSPVIASEDGRSGRHPAFLLEGMPSAP